MDCREFSSAQTGQNLRAQALNSRQQVYNLWVTSDVTFSFQSHVRNATETFKHFQNRAADCLWSQLTLCFTFDFTIHSGVYKACDAQVTHPVCTSAVCVRGEAAASCSCVSSTRVAIPLWRCFCLSTQSRTSIIPISNKTFHQKFNSYQISTEKRAQWY